MNQQHKYKKYPSKPFQQLSPLFFIIFIDSLAYFLVIPVLLRLFINKSNAWLPAHTSMAIRNDLFSIAIALSTLAFMLAAPFIGYLSDRYGRKKILFFCLLVSFISFVLPVIGIIKHYISLIFIGRFIGGGATSSQPIAQAAITDFSDGRRKAFYLSMIAFAMTLAMVCGPIAGSYLSDANIISWFNITIPYYFGILLSLLNILLLYFCYHDTAQIKAHSLQISWWEKAKHLQKLLANKQVYLLILIFLFLELAWSQYYQSIFLVLKQLYSYNADKIGLFTGYIGLWMSLGLTICYRIFIRYFSVKKILGFSLFGATVGLILCNNYASPLWQWLGIIPTSVFVGSAYTSLLTMMSNRTAKTYQGWILGLASASLGLAWMITGFTQGFLINQSIAFPIATATCFMLIAMILLLYFFALGKKFDDQTYSVASESSR